LQANDAQGAIENHRRSLAIIGELAAADPGSAENKKDVSVTKQYLAEAQLAAGEHDAALINLRQILPMLETELKAGNPDLQIKDDLALCLVNIGKILSAKGDVGGAAEVFRRALPLAEEVLQKTPFSVRFKTRHAASFFEAGKVFAKLAKTQIGEKSETIKGESCDSLNRSFDIWNEMRQAGTLSKIYVDRPDEAAKALAACKIQ
jgi:tetratricopeptide (TPR) repeat protein